MNDGRYGDITIDVSSMPYETGFKFNTVPFGGMTIDAGNAVRLSSASVLIVDTAGDRPPASDRLRGALYFERGGATTRDRLSICMKSEAGAYDWIEIANGGA